MSWKLVWGGDKVTLIYVSYGRCLLVCMSGLLKPRNLILEQGNAHNPSAHMTGGKADWEISAVVIPTVTK